MDKKLLDILACPTCKSKLHFHNDLSELWCHACKLAFPIKDDIPVMLENEARNLTSDEIQK